MGISKLLSLFVNIFCFQIFIVRSEAFFNKSFLALSNLCMLLICRSVGIKRLYVSLIKVRHTNFQSPLDDLVLWVIVKIITRVTVFCKVGIFVSLFQCILSF